jgi:NADH-quinone oxidoreductase subunit H
MIMYFHTTNANIMVSEQAGGTWDLFVHPVQAIKDGAVGGWGLFVHPLLAIIFFTCVLAECNRAPFDLAEAEQELVGGFHTEYSSMRWAMFFLGEYMHMITGCAFFTVMFLGGWDIFPFLPILPDTAEGHWLWVVALAGLKFTVFALKVFLLLFIMMWIRWTLPRLRFDQLMKLAWRGLIPITIFMLLVTGVMVFLDAPAWSYFFANVAVTVGAMVIGPMLPKGPSVNRKIPLKGSRFSPLVESEFEPA